MKDRAHAIQRQATGRIAQVGRHEPGPLCLQLRADRHIAPQRQHFAAIGQQLGHEHPPKTPGRSGDEGPPVHSRSTAPPSETPAELPISSTVEPGVNRPSPRARCSA